MTAQLTLIVLAAIVGGAGVLCAPAARRRVVAYATILGLFGLLAVPPAVAGFTANPSGHTHPAPILPFSARTLPATVLASTPCTWTGGTTVRLDWNALSNTYSWVGGFQLVRDTNGGADTGVATVTPYSATNASDATASSPGSNTYTYKVHATASGWSGPYSATVDAQTCVDRITTAALGSTTAEIHASNGVFVDSSGNIYIADTGGNRVEYVAAASCSSSCPYGLSSTTAGYMYILAGASTGGSTGDGGAAGSARLNSPEAITADASGDIYIGDTGNNKVRVISNGGCPCVGVTIAKGNIDTVIGGGASSADAVCANSTCGATVAQLSGPKGIALDSLGNVAVSDTGNNKVRLVSVVSGTNTYYGVSMAQYKIYTIAGSTSGFSDATPATSGQMNSQQQIAIDSSNNIYIADTGNKRVRKEARSNNALTTVAGNGSSPYDADNKSATTSQLATTTTGVAVDSSGNIYISASTDNRVRMVAASTGTYFGQSMTSGFIYTIAGTGTNGYTGPGYPTASSKIVSPKGMSFGNGHLYFSDTGNDMIRMISSHNNLIAAAGNGTAGAVDGVAAAGADLVAPEGVAVDSSGNVYIADKTDDRVRKWFADTNEVATIAGAGTSGATGDGSTAIAAKLSVPEGVAVDSSGNVYIADTGNNKIRAVSQSGTTVLGVTIAQNNIDTVAGCCGTGGFGGDGSPATGASTKLNAPKGVDVDSAGDLIIADTANNRIRFVPNSASMTRYGNSSMTQNDMYSAASSLGAPDDIAVDSSNIIYIADTTNNVIKKETTAGTVTTVVGTGSAGHSGDGGAATSALLSAPTGVAVDGTNIYIADGGLYLREYSTATANITAAGGDGTGGVSGDYGGATGAHMSVFGVTEKPSGNIWTAGGTTTNIQLRQILGPI